MKTQEAANYERIANAIEYIHSNYKEQPNLDEVAEKVAMSPFHFQRMFTEWAGVSPKKFLQYITVSNAKKILKETGASLFPCLTKGWYILIRQMSRKGSLRPMFAPRFCCRK